MLAAWILFLLLVDLSSPSVIHTLSCLRLMLGPAGFPLQILTGLRGCCRVLALSVILLSSEFSEEDGGYDVGYESALKPEEQLCCLALLCGETLFYWTEAVILGAHFTSTHSIFKG